MTLQTITLKRGVGLPWYSAGQHRGTRTFRVVLGRIITRSQAISEHDEIKPMLTGTRVLKVFQGVTSEGHTVETGPLTQSHKLGELITSDHIVPAILEVAESNIDGIA